MSGRSGFAAFLSFLLLTCALPAAACAAPAPAVGAEGLDGDALFTKEDMLPETEPKDVKNLTLKSGRDLVIDSAGFYVLSGEVKETTVLVNAGKNDRVFLILNGLTIDNKNRACIEARSAAKVCIAVVEDSRLTVRKNFSKDGDSKGSAVIWSRPDLSLSGAAELNITSPKHGIDCKDHLRIVDGTYVITADAKAISADNAIWIESGSFLIKGGTDGLHAENGDDDREGTVYIGSGDFDITAVDDAIHGQYLVQIDGGELVINADEGIESTWVLVNGGTLDICATGDGINAAHKSDARRPLAEFTGGTVNITAKGEDSDAIDSNGDIIISGGTIRVNGNGIDWDGNMDFSGGTVIINGKKVTDIPNRDSDHP